MMKNELVKRCLLSLILVVLTVSAAFSQEKGPRDVKSSSGKGNLVKVAFHETDTIVCNPGQGWMSSRLPSSIMYFRVSWVDLEPEHGKYNWSAIDDKIASAKQKGMGVAFRIVTCNPHSKGYYSTPKWLFDEGCKSYEYVVPGTDPYAGGPRFPRNEPDYSDSLFLLRHRELILAMGQRYNESPDIAFLDIGSYGYWGEWHTRNPVPVAARMKIVDMYRLAFPDKQLVFMTDDAEVLGYALEKGAGLRRDGVGSPGHEKSWIGSPKYAGVKGMEDAWKYAPVVFEWYGNYDYLVSRGWSFESAVDFMLRNHVTVINDNIGKLPAEKMPQIEKLAKLAGARFVLNELTHEKKVKRGSSLTIDMNWTNSGVGKVYVPYKLRFFLLDEADKVVLTHNTKADLRSWFPGKFEVKDSILILQSLKKGTYKLALALVNEKINQPSFHLAINVHEKNGMYIVSKFRVN